MSSADHEAERHLQRSYWQSHSTEGTVEEMMLDSHAQELDTCDRTEVLAGLGSVANKTVLELGAGIGRFTGHLARDASNVIACDFMENLIQENKKRNGVLNNISFLAEDASELQLEEDSVDVVFSNWLLMYLSDHEVEHLIHSALCWLREGGVLFFRESCYRQAGDRKRQENPTHYRDMISYFTILDRVFQKSENGKYYKFKLVTFSNMKTYVKEKQNFGQLYWKLIKVEKEPDQVEFRHFLDQVQYTRNGILRYEKLFGYGFISTGGVETTDSLVRRLELKPGHSVLDVGCGVGGGDFYLADKYGVDVLGIDLSVNMVALALERACTGAYTPTKGTVTFEVADCTTKDFPNGSFDVIYSRDTLLHIQDKPALFKRMHDWLKPGGQVLITDYCRSAHEASPGFAAYIKQRGYDLHPVPVYGQMLTDAGFTEVLAEDTTTSMFVPSLEKELSKAAEMKTAFLEECSEDDYTAVVHGWKDKIERATAGEQRWGLFHGKKPLY